MKFMENCIFCKIIAGEIPSYKIYEDEKFFAFLDISPVNPGHTLVIPKEHFPDFLAAPETVVSGLFAAAKKVAAAVQRGLAAGGFNLNVNNGEAAGQVVPHLHIHIMPRRQGDGYKLWPGRPYAAGEAEKIAAKIRGAV